VIRAGSGAGTAAARGRAASVRAGRGDIPGRGAAARAVTSLAPGSARGGPVGGPCPATTAGIAVTGLPAAALHSAFRTMPGAWNGSWNGAPGNPSTASAISGITRGISAASAFSGRGRTYGKEKVYGSIP
jgi:hypothetical protein